MNKVLKRVSPTTAVSFAGTVAAIMLLAAMFVEVWK